MRRVNKPQSISKQELQSLASGVRLVLLTAAEIEAKAVVANLSPLPDRDHVLRGYVGGQTYEVGLWGCYPATHTRCSQGSVQRDGSLNATRDAIEFWEPKAVIMIGLAFGRDSASQQLGDVLISETVAPYEYQRAGAKYIQRGSISESGLILLNRFRDCSAWSYKLGPTTESVARPGQILSGEKLVDDPKFHAGLFESYPHAIGGEMEGAGIYAAAARKKIEWIIVKGICDWGHGKTSDHQEIAIEAAVSLCLHKFSDPHAFAELGLNPVELRHESGSAQMRAGTGTQHVTVTTPAILDSLSPRGVPACTPESHHHEHPLLARMRQYGDVTITHELIQHDTESIRHPNFLLFRRGSQIVMTIASSGCAINPNSLQKTSEPQVQSVLLDANTIEALGFQKTAIHPFFIDQTSTIDRIICDANLLGQCLLRPQSQIVLPRYDESNALPQLITRIDVFLAGLMSIHGARKVVFANIAVKGWPDSIIANALRSVPLQSRFAPTPSNHLHIGSARTALISYLFALQHSKHASFHLRIDDTDDSRSRPELLAELEDDLRWMGLEWPEAACFRQRERLAHYVGFQRMLAAAELVEHVDDGSVTLRPAERDDYYNFWIDWKTGPQIVHKPPTDRRGIEKPVNIARPGGGNHYYRFAGVIDDMIGYPPDAEKTKTVVVFRDERQRHLTEVQAHIRMTLDKAREQCSRGDSHEGIFAAAAINPLCELPLPVYCILPCVADHSGEILKKRKQHDQYTLASLRESEAILPEGLVAYLLATITPRRSQETWSNHLMNLAQVLGAHGLKVGLRLVAPRLDLFHLVGSTSLIRCDLRHIAAAGRMAMHSMAAWCIRQRLRNYVPNLRDSDPIMIDRIVGAIRQFANWSQVLAVVRGPHHPVEIASDTRQWLRRLLRSKGTGGEAAPLEIVEVLKSTISSERAALRSLTPGGPARRKAYGALSQRQGDLRLLLTGHRDSPKLEALLDIIGSECILERLRVAL